jgi:hypothetical protein
MNCKTCKSPCAWAGKEESEHGKCLVGYTPITNADCVRAMSDEELAEWLSCPGKKEDMFPNLEIYIAPNTDEWLGWLKQEADE